MSQRTSMNEAEYLKRYNPKDFDIPLVGVDTVLFTYHEEALKVLLVQRDNHPDKGKWALPGGFVDLEQDANLEETALRKIREKTGVEPAYIEQLATFGSKFRDKRGWSVSVCFTALVAYQNCETHVASVSEADWIAMNTVQELDFAFDHRNIIEAARERLKQKALYSIVPVYTLPEKFTLPELQHIHEVLVGKPLQKKSFRRRIEQAGLLEETGEMRREAGRPAMLYKVKPGTDSFRFIRNLEE